MESGAVLFGLSRFREQSSLFMPNLDGPVDANYGLGTGDQPVLILTGDVELAHTLDVYDYLLSGDGANDVCLHQGYVVFVPGHGRRARIIGGVEYRTPDEGAAHYYREERHSSPTDSDRAVA